MNIFPYIFTKTCAPSCVLQFRAPDATRSKRPWNSWGWVFWSRAFCRYGGAIRPPWCELSPYAAIQFTSHEEWKHLLHVDKDGSVNGSLDCFFCGSFVSREYIVCITCSTIYMRMMARIFGGGGEVRGAIGLNFTNIRWKNERKSNFWLIISIIHPAAPIWQECQIEMDVFLVLTLLTIIFCGLSFSRHSKTGFTRFLQLKKT